MATSVANEAEAQGCFNFGSALLISLKPGATCAAMQSTASGQDYGLVEATNMTKRNATRDGCSTWVHYWGGIRNSSSLCTTRTLSINLRSSACFFVGSCFPRVRFFLAVHVCPHGAWWGLGGSLHPPPLPLALLLPHFSSPCLFIHLAGCVIVFPCFPLCMWKCSAHIYIYIYIYYLVQFGRIGL